MSLKNCEMQKAELPIDFFFLHEKVTEINAWIA